MEVEKRSAEQSSTAHDHESCRAGAAVITARLARAFAACKEDTEKADNPALSQLHTCIKMGASWEHTLSHVSRAARKSAARSLPSGALGIARGIAASAPHDSAYTALCRIIRVVYEVKREVNLTETLAIGPAMRTLEAQPIARHSFFAFQLACTACARQVGEHLEARRRAGTP